MSGVTTRRYVIRANHARATAGQDVKIGDIIPEGIVLDVDPAIFGSVTVHTVLGPVTIDKDSVVQVLAHLADDALDPIKEAVAAR